jgi:hypothetical protein
VIPALAAALNRNERLVCMLADIIYSRRRGIKEFAQLRASVNAVQDARLRAIEILQFLAIFVSEFNGELEVGTVKTCVSVNVSAAATKDAFKIRSVFGHKRDATAAAHVH